MAVSNDISGIICDLSMPGTDGTAFVEKAHAAGCGVPMVLSGMASHDSIVTSRKAGANGWLVKPCDGREFLYSLRELSVSMAPPNR
ncbi:MAG: response regulator [Polyangiaceae bacterium]|nr:response regulator [Polyangiaceae bacterium]